MGASTIDNVLIASMRRSGGTLLVRLLEGHPDCSVLPFEHCHTSKKAVYRWQEDRLFSFFSPGRKLRACDFGGGFERKLARYHGPVDTTAFENELLELAAHTRERSALYRPAADLYFRHFQSTSLRRILVNHCARLCVLPSWQIRRIFGRHRLIVSVRDPRAVYSSLEHKRNQDYDETIIPAFCTEWEASVERYHFGDESAVSFRFEDLVADPESVMQKVARDLDIAFDPILLAPTKLGEPARANTSFARSGGIDPSAGESWKSKLLDRPRRQIEDRLGPLMRRLGYL